MRFMRLRLSIMATVVLIGLCVGCDNLGVGAQARASLSSFVTGVVSSAINDVINGNQ